MNMKTAKWTTGLLMTALLSACGIGADNGESICPDSNRVLVDGHKYCVMDQEIIEKGFVCPADLSYRHEIPGTNGGIACSDQAQLPSGDEQKLKDIIITPPNQNPWLNHTPEPGNNITVGCQMPAPDHQECAMDSDCEAGKTCVVSATQECVPSSCSCDEASGEWICTADCGSRNVCVDAEPAPACDPAQDPSWQECTVDSDCPEDEQCVIADQDACLPSSCGCDETTGQWTVCTEDCNPRYECSPQTEPQGCGDDSQVFCAALPEPCPEGLIREARGGCWGECVDPVTCEAPAYPCTDGSQLSCRQAEPECADGQTPEIVNGCYGECVDAATCEVTAPCGTGQEILCDGLPPECASGLIAEVANGCYTGSCVDPETCEPGPACSATEPVLCNALPPACGAGQIPEVDEGCYTGRCLDATTCEPAAQICGGEPDPSFNRCYTDDDCANAQVCNPTATLECAPSSCFCDETSGTWGCTEDCAPGICGDAPTCQGPDPSEQECTVDADCPGADNKCVLSDAAVCVPSACSCDETGQWLCTADCGPSYQCSVE